MYMRILFPPLTTAVSVLDPELPSKWTLLSGSMLGEQYCSYMRQFKDEVSGLLQIVSYYISLNHFSEQP